MKKNPLRINEMTNPGMIALNEMRRPGILTLAETIHRQNPMWPMQRVLAEAKEQWRRNQVNTR